MIQKRFIVFIIFATLDLISGDGLHAQWVQISPEFGGTVTSLAIQDSILLAGSTAGIFSTTNNGSTWTNIDTDLSTHPVYDLAISDSILFAATGDSGGVYSFSKTPTGWMAKNTHLPSSNVLSIATFGKNIFAGTSDRGIFLSTNSGISWQADTIGLPPYSTVWTIRRVHSELFAMTRPGGVFRSTDTGKSWATMNIGLGKDSIWVMDFCAFDSNDDSHAIVVGASGGVYRATNNSNQWFKAGIDLPTDAFVMNLFISGRLIFMASDGNGVFMSSDGGITWTPENLGLSELSLHAVASNSKYLFVGTYKGDVWRRPLSEMIGTSAVSPVARTIRNEIHGYPNPFSQSTQITFTPQASGYAEVSIFNQLGVVVARLFSGELDAGEQHTFTWNNPSALPDGVYECLVRMNGQVEKLPIVLLR